MPLPPPQDLNQLAGYAGVPAPVTSSAPNGFTLWLRAELVDHVPHPSARLTRSVLRPGEWNTPRQRLEEEAATTAPLYDPRVPAGVTGPPPGWQVCALTPRILLNVDYSTTPHTLTEAEGITDPDQLALWCRATDDAVTAEGTALMRSYSWELRRAWVYHVEMQRTGDHAHASREAFAVGGGGTP